jgi:hypothetical protein
MSQYTTSVRDAFFGRENIVASVKQCVKSLSYYTDDPLVSFANVGIHQPLCFTVTTQGLCPFENNVRIMIPYDSMSNTQLLVIQNLMDVGSAKHDFINCSHENGDFSVTAVSDRRAVSVDPSLVIFGIFSLIRSAATVQDLDAGTILSVMQQHIISTVCLHQQQLQQAWRLINEEDKALQTAKSKAGTTPS